MSSKRRFALGLLALAVIASCSRIHTIGEAVYVPGDAPVHEKLGFAQEVGAQVWETGLTDRVREVYPKLTDQQLSGVFLRWETITVTPVTGEGQSGTGARIRTGIQHRGDVENAEGIAKLCADAVEEAISQRLGTSDIHRIDLREQSLSF